MKLPVMLFVWAGAILWYVLWYYGFAAYLRITGQIDSMREYRMYGFAIAGLFFGFGAGALVMTVWLIFWITLKGPWVTVWK